jgi:hypothetical protein
MVQSAIRKFNGKKFKMWNKYTSEYKAEKAKFNLISKRKKNVRIVKVKRRGTSIIDYYVYYRPYPL